MPLLRTSMEWTGLGGSPYFTVHHFVGDGDAAHAADAVDAQDTFYDTIASLITSQLTWSISGEVEVIDIPTGDVTAVHQVTPETGVGGSSAEALPLTTQLLVRWRTGVFNSGRELRGKTFIPGMIEPSNDVGGAPTSAAVTGFQNAAITFAGDSAGLGIYSRVYNMAATVASVNVWNKWAILTSRRD